MKTFSITYSGRFDEADPKTAATLKRVAEQGATAFGGVGADLQSARLVIESAGAHHNQAASKSHDLLAPVTAAEGGGDEAAPAAEAAASAPAPAVDGATATADTSAPIS